MSEPRKNRLGVTRVDARQDAAAGHWEARLIAQEITGYIPKREYEVRSAFLAGWDAAMKIRFPELLAENEALHGELIDRDLERFKSERPTGGVLVTPGERFATCPNCGEGFEIHWTPTTGQLDHFETSLNRLCSLALTCRVVNTNEWMELLVEHINEACEVMNDPDRFKFDGREIVNAKRFT